MESSTVHTGTAQNVATEFGSWPIEGSALDNANAARVAYNNLLTTISPMFLKGNERYFSVVKTKLEEACFFTIKGIAKPGNGGN